MWKWDQFPPPPMEILEKTGAIITGTHVVFASGKHGDTYINKDAVYPHTTETSRLCHAIAERFAGFEVEAVIGPALGGIILSQWTAHYLTRMNGRTVFAIYAEKESDGFVIKRGYGELIVGKRVLVVEDVLTTGGSARKVVQAVRAAGGRVIGLGAICNRGGVARRDAGGVPQLRALADVRLDAWDEADCPLCNTGVPVNTDVGKGREFLARRS